MEEQIIKHITGESLFVNDIAEPNDFLTGDIFYSSKAYAKIKKYDISKAKSYPGVYAVLSYKDIPGINQMGPVINDELCLAEDKVTFIGQGIFLIAAINRETAIEAKKLISIEYEELEPVLSIEDAIKKNTLMHPERKIERGNIEEGLKTSTHIIKGTLKTGAQEHWYLETQTTLAISGESNEMKIFSSTQHPSETQEITAKVLGINKNQVEVENRRIGGAFGGKETQANHTAAWAALLCKATGRPVKIHLFRDDDQIITGKRHPFLINYTAGFNEEGIINTYDVELNSDGGAATDLSLAILERAMLHADNAYYIPNIRIIGKVYKTNHLSNTAMRGFGAPQAVAAIENIIEMIARYLNKDSSEIRRKNFYKTDNNNITPYGQKVENNRLDFIYEKIYKSSEYILRKKSIDEFNAQNKYFKKGISLTPVKFGISFTTSFLNQAGALVIIYRDGTVLVNHGGIEMGQGLNIKIRNIAACEFGLDKERIKIAPTNTSKIPNTSATAASTGSDLNGMAVKIAIDKIKKRLMKFAADIFNSDNYDRKTFYDDIVFRKNFIIDSADPDRKISFTELVERAYIKQISLFDTGYYRTPNIWFDRVKGTGKPFHYYVFGMAVSEILLDVLTGEIKIIRTDILHDPGRSLDENIDLGQVTGGFIQGSGYCTTEDIKWDKEGNLLNHSPDTYKIPTIDDIPVDFRVELLKDFPDQNPDTIRKSKAVGEPPFLLAFSVWLAIKYAISSICKHTKEPEFSIPATNENILQSIEKLINF